MRAGKLDRSISIERKTESVSVTGAVVTAWQVIAAVRAELITQSTDEFLTSFGAAEDGSVIFRIRYLAGVTTADRVTYDGKNYDLKEVVEVGRRRGLELRAAATS